METSPIMPHNYQQIVVYTGYLLLAAMDFDTITYVCKTSFVDEKC